ncbi:MAG: helix-turn-helix domain-containing protein [Planctomycetaceae bacterium]|jgi:transcriptional regulator with XRE-family HTH domain|nr:helix-turn-helix domain-containing protein [Planctomycetaceae bacterium]
MSHLIPPVVVSSVSVNIPQTSQPIELLPADMESAQLSDNSHDLLPTDSLLSDLKSEIIYVEESEKTSNIVSELLTDTNNNLTCLNTDEIVENIIAIPENINRDTEKINNNCDNIVTKNIAIEINSNSTNDIEQGDVKNISDDVGKINNSVKVRSRSSSRQLLPQLTRFHRIAAVRLEQGVSLSRAAKRLHLDISEAREQENESTDLKLSQLYKWRDILDISVGELVVEPEEIPTNPIKNRCQLVRLMKTVRSIIIESNSEVILILARHLESQLIELMPELATIAAWPSLGQSRNAHSPGAAVTRCQGFGNIYLRRTAITKNNAD